MFFPFQPGDFKANQPLIFRGVLLWPSSKWMAHPCDLRRCQGWILRWAFQQWECPELMGETWAGDSFAMEHKGKRCMKYTDIHSIILYIQDIVSYMFIYMYTYICNMIYIVWYIDIVVAWWFAMLNSSSHPASEKSKRNLNRFFAMEKKSQELSTLGCRRWKKASSPKTHPPKFRKKMIQYYEIVI